MKSINDKFNRFGEPFQKVIILFIVLSVALFIIIHFANTKIGYDTGLYHLQKVQWLDEYGHVTGLANLDGRLGFYSIYFYVGAIIRSVSDADEPLLYINLVIALCFVCWVGWRSFHEKDFAFRILYLFSLFGLLFYLGLIKSMYQDLGGFVCIQMVFLECLKRWEQGKETPVYKLLFYLALIVSIKFSYVFVLSAVFFLIPALVKETWSWRNAGYGIGVLFLAVLMIYHNYILTGWLVYPFSGLDVFDVDWKVPAYLVTNMQDVVKAFARIPGSIQDVYEVNQMGLLEWFPLWFNRLGDYQWLLYMLALSIVWNGIHNLWAFRSQKKLGVMQVVLIITILGWFLGAPDLRFGFVWLFLNYSLSVYYIINYLDSFLRSKMLQIIILCTVTGIAFYAYAQTSQVISYVRHDYPPLSLSLTVEIPSIPLKKITIPQSNEQEFIFVPATGERAYHATQQPIASRLFIDSIMPFINDVPRWRGKNVQDGFYTDSTQTVRKEHVLNVMKSE